MSIVGRYNEYNAFIPVVYSDNKTMYIMKRASKLSADMLHEITQFYENI